MNNAIHFAITKPWMAIYPFDSVIHPLTLYLPDQICNSPYCQPFNSYNISSGNLLLDQLIIPKLTFFFILITYLVVIVRRKSVLVTHGV